MSFAISEKQQIHIHFTKRSVIGHGPPLPWALGPARCACPRQETVPPPAIHRHLSKAPEFLNPRSTMFLVLGIRGTPDLNRILVRVLGGPLKGLFFCGFLLIWQEESQVSNHGDSL